MLFALLLCLCHYITHTAILGNLIHTLFRLCLKQSGAVFPEAGKSSFVTPISKAGDTKYIFIKI